MCTNAKCGKGIWHPIALQSTMLTCPKCGETRKISVDSWGKSDGGEWRSRLFTESEYFMCYRLGLVNYKIWQEQLHNPVIEE